MSSNPTLKLWTRLSRQPGGKWLFSQLLCLKAPYFRSISPRFVELRPAFCEVAVTKRRKVLNHIGTVHAIAMCNMAELAAGVMTEATIPGTHRWIPKGMTVEYLRKAESSVTATAKPVDAIRDWTVASNYEVEVLVRDQAGETVFRALITMWVSPKK